MPEGNVMSADDAAPREPGHIAPLTSLRFVAAIWVVLFHYWPHLAVDGTPGLIAKGYLGVELFFVLSGFILCHVYLREAEAGTFSYGRFVWARLARIYPLHLAVLAGVGLMGAAAAVAGVSVDPNLTDWRALPAHLTMTHAWGLSPVAGWNHPSWSISAEWFAYLLVPAFAWAALKLKDRPWLAVSAAMLLLAGLYIGFEAVTGQPLTRATIAWGALRIVPCFFLGCAGYLLFRSGWLRSRRAALCVAAGSAALLLGAAELQLWDALTVFACGALIVSLAAAWREGSGVMGRPTWVWLGEVSFAVYMVCVPWQQVYVNGVSRVLGFPDERLPAPLWIALLAGVVPIAAVAHHLVEKPARAWMRRLRPVRPMGAAAG